MPNEEYFEANKRKLLPSYTVMPPTIIFSLIDCSLYCIVFLIRFRLSHRQSIPLPSLYIKFHIQFVMYVCLRAWTLCYFVFYDSFFSLCPSTRLSSLLYPSACC